MQNLKNNFLKIFLRMNKVWGLSVIWLCLWTKQSSGQTLSTYIDSVSYAAGVSIGATFKKHGVNNINFELVTIAIKDALGENGKNPLMDKQFSEKLFNQYVTALKTKAGRDFLADNAKKDGVVVLPSGLQYKVLKKGEGTVKPTAQDRVKTHYHGTLIDGSVFDSSVERGMPAEFQVSKVIKGWTEGLQLMVVGDKYQFYIPFELAYGERGSSGKIGPFSTLIFEVELLEILPGN